MSLRGITVALSREQLTFRRSISVHLVSSFISLDSTASPHIQITTHFLFWSKPVLLNWRPAVQLFFLQWWVSSGFGSQTLNVNFLGHHYFNTKPMAVWYLSVGYYKAVNLPNDTKLYFVASKRSHWLQQKSILNDGPARWSDQTKNSSYCR